MKRKISKVIKHLKEDVKTFDREKAEDKALMKKLKPETKKERKEHERKGEERYERKERKAKKENIIKDEMHRFKKGKLHSGSDKGPIVENPKQAIAISLSVAKKKMKKKK